MRTSEKTYRNECQEGHVEPAKTLRAVNSIDLGRSYMKYLSGFVSKKKKGKNYNATREVTRFLCISLYLLK